MKNSNSKYYQIPITRGRRNEKLEIRILQNPKQIPIFITSSLFFGYSYYAEITYTGRCVQDK